MNIPLSIHPHPYRANSVANKAFSFVVAQETEIVTPFSLAPLSAPQFLIVLFRITANVDSALSTSTLAHCKLPQSIRPL